LQPGDVVTTTTGQGVARYRVTNLRDSRVAVTTTVGVARNELVLVTSAPAMTPAYSLIATAELITKAQPAPGRQVALPADERSLAVDYSGLLPLMLWGQALVVAVAVTTWTYHRWARVPAYLVTSPVIAAVGWNVYESLARLLPNTL